MKIASFGILIKEYQLKDQKGIVCPKVD